MLQIRNGLAGRAFARSNSGKLVPNDGRDITQNVRADSGQVMLPMKMVLRPAISTYLSIHERPSEVAIHAQTPA